MIAITTENGSLLIYNNSTLAWCAELLESDTIAVQRGNFTGLAGGLASLTLTGKLSVGYLGSSPSIFKVPSMNLNKIDYYKSKVALDEMEREINASVDNSGGFEDYKKSVENSPPILHTDVLFINESAERSLSIKSQLNREGEHFVLRVDFCTVANLEQVQIIINSSNPALSVYENIFFFDNLKGSDKVSFETAIEVIENQACELFTNKITLLASFINKQSIARAIKHEVFIPPQLCLERVSPQKDAVFKVTLTVANSDVLTKLLSGMC